MKAKFSGKIYLPSVMAEDLIYETLFYLSGELLKENGKVRVRYQNPSGIIETSENKFEVWVAKYLKPQFKKYKDINFRNPIPIKQFVEICETQNKEGLDELLGDDIYYSS